MMWNSNILSEKNNFSHILWLIVECALTLNLSVAVMDTCDLHGLYKLSGAFTGVGASLHIWDVQDTTSISIIK